MAQNINLSDRVRFLPGLKKKDLPPMFDSIFIGTVYMKFIDTSFPTDFSSWTADQLFNYNSIIGIRDNSGDKIASGTPALISDLDYNIFKTIGIDGTDFPVINPSVRNNYQLFYGERTKDDGSHSGFVFYTVYDVQSTSPAGDNKAFYSMAIDMWESNIFINDATNYEEIN
jgi:hypothetical protein